MSKYIDADLLKKEIERQKSLFSTEKRKEGLSKTDKLSLGARIASLEETIVLITSLQQEQPEVDLEKEIIDYFQGMWPGTETAEQCNTDMHFTPLAIIRMVKHFYELSLKARKEE